MLYTDVRDLHYSVECISLAISVKQLLTHGIDKASDICGIRATRGIKGIGHKKVCELRNSRMHAQEFHVFSSVSIRFCYSLFLCHYWIALGSIVYMLAWLQMCYNSAELYMCVRLYSSKCESGYLNSKLLKTKLFILTMLCIVDPQI